MYNYNFFGNHIIAELYEVSEDKIGKTRKLIKVLLAGIRQAGATPIKTISHKFKPTGITVFALLKESHVSLHIYPEFKAVFFDAFTCGTANPQIVLDEVIKFLSPRTVEIKSISRGLKGNSS